MILKVIEIPEYILIKKYVRFGYIPWKNVTLFHFHCLFPLFRLLRSLKYFNIFFKKIKSHLCLVKQYLIWFKLRCLSRILAISWEKRILNFIKIVYFFQFGNLISDQNLSGFAFVLFVFVLGLLWKVFN